MSSSATKMYRVDVQKIVGKARQKLHGREIPRDYIIPQWKNELDHQRPLASWEAGESKGLGHTDSTKLCGIIDDSKTIYVFERCNPKCRRTELLDYS